MIELPRKGNSKEDTLGEMKALRDKDANWKEGKTWSLVFFAGNEIVDLLQDAYGLFFSENGLNPTAFPSLRKFETEVVSMTAHLLGGDQEVSGNMTSGGTESILMAVKTAREWAKKNMPKVKEPEILLPTTAHPAFDKAAHYFSLKTVHIPVKEDFCADVEAMKAAVNENTILMVGSAPSYPHGVVDSISELAEIAQEKNILFHVDACVGGFMLPFVRDLGYDIPAFDFQVPGVTSLSVDLHKYAYAAKGASVILYRNANLRKHQFFVYTDWPGGIYASPTMVGTRPGGAIAAAWSIMNYLGYEGYLEIARRVMETRDKLKERINAIEGVEVLGDPHMSILAIGSQKEDIYIIADAMTKRGWHPDRQQFPASMHLTITAAHSEEGVVDAFIQDLEEAVEEARKAKWDKISSSVAVSVAKGAAKVLPKKVMSQVTQLSSPSPTGGKMPEKTAAMYGLIGSLPNRGDVESVILNFLDKIYSIEKEEKE